jgi:hypothetical protein
VERARDQSQRKLLVDLSYRTVTRGQKVTRSIRQPVAKNIPGKLPKDVQALKCELTRAFLNYLRVEDLTGAAGKMEAEQMAAVDRWRKRTSQNV